ncbi:peptidase [Streptomyces spiroverticillatus]|uniref:Peptidase n=1 Tax=Streptomyces finlayi TaxID=67296 RepID=A0A918X4T3_9ACTN|nr:M23 family metallopeptidase [Streptomyces finlayi]GHA34660.1 peptidase [Streptomyces spiroverticillatus]GHD12176.1 peptidase [Streptomyces finlayi]
MSKLVSRRVRNAVVAATVGAACVAGTGSAFAASGAPVKTAPAKAAAEKKAPAAQAKAARTKLWAKPLQGGYALSATFGKGGNMWSHNHSGQDFAVPVGTVVKAASAGTVVKAGPNGGGDGPAYGNAIVVKHTNGTYSQYAHLSRIQVKIGQPLAAGQQIALSGNTGNSSGPHLHFEIRTTPNYGSAVNPVAFLRSVGVNV